MRANVASAASDEKDALRRCHAPELSRSQAIAQLRKASGGSDRDELFAAPL